MKQYKEKHLRSTNSGGYLETSQVNQELSYHLKSKPTVNGGKYVYQYVTMNDGEIYELISNTAETKGIIANNCRDTGLLQRTIKRLSINAINY